MQRRDFIKILSGSMALVAAGCRRPNEQIVPLVSPVEYMVPGHEDCFSTVFMHGGVAHGVIVKLREGKPIKIDGNPDHPVTQGGSSAIMQASLYNLYDPERFRKPRVGKKSVTLDEAVGEAISKILGSINSGRMTAVLIEPHSSPSFHRLIKQIEEKIPRIRFFVYDPVNRNDITGNETVPDISKAELIVTLEADLLGSHPNSVYYNKEYSKRKKDSGGFRLVSVEAGLSLTGANADRRVAISPEYYEDFAVSLLAFLESIYANMPYDINATDHEYRVDAAHIAELIIKAGNKSVVVAGRNCSITTRKAVDLINNKTGSFGYGRIIDPAFTMASGDYILNTRGEMVSELQSGKYDTIIFAGTNPFYSDRELFESISRNITNKISISLYPSETTQQSYISIPTTHYLENWGDAEFFDGSISIQQPVIAPLNENSASIQDLLIRIAKGLKNDVFSETENYYQYVKNNWKEFSNDRIAWEDVLRKGYFKPESSLVKTERKIPADINISSFSKKEKSGLILMAVPSPYLYDGSLANNAWLQELPHPVTKTMWGNVASINPGTAKRYGLAEEDVIKIKSEKGSIELPVHIQHGIADQVIITELGYGRKDCGQISNGTGSNAFELFDYHASNLYIPVDIKKTGRIEAIAKSQHYDSTDGRDIFRTIDSKDSKDTGHEGDSEQRITNNDQQKAAPYPAIPQGRREISNNEQPSLYPGYKYKGHRWGMVIDLDLCTGCNACVTACQVENNIAVVGKEDAANGRLLHWIRIDRYYKNNGDEAKVMFEPMLCQHCQQAPCEPVCPVSASSHSPEGLNETTYNRCVGTRFCMANCPYKVRRFNFRDYSERTKQPLNYAYNPSVTVRMRGVVEKCTFCVQRINAAKYRAKDEGRNRLEDGEIKTACQQACPAGAIIFGDLNDPESMVSKLSKDGRAFRVLEELNTRPAVIYLSEKS